MTQNDWQIVGRGSVALEVSATYEDQRNDWKRYKVTATPANGWRFDHFEWDQRVVVTREYGSKYETVYSYSKTENPYDDSLQSSIDLADGDWYPYLYIDEKWTMTIENAKAVFVENGHGIIYSPANRRIVYSNEFRVPIYYP